MATVAGIKIKTKVAKTRNPIFFDEKYTGGEPVWNTQEAQDWPDDKFDHRLRESFYYYNYYYNQKDCKKYVVEWLKTMPTEFTKEEVKAFDRAADRAIPMTACSLIMARRQGMVFRTRHTDFLKQVIRTAILEAEPEAIEITSSFH